MAKEKIEEARKQLALMRMDIGTFGYNFLGAEHFKRRIDKVDKLLREATHGDVANSTGNRGGNQDSGKGAIVGNSERRLLK